MSLRMTQATKSAFVDRHSKKRARKKRVSSQALARRNLLCQTLEPRYLLSANPTPGVLMERYEGISGTTIASLTADASFPGTPSVVSISDDFESPTNVADNYGVRMRSFLSVPETGEYTFWIAADDEGELRLSTDDTAANASLIASVSGGTNSQEWDKYASQESSTISLVAGDTLYIEALMKEGSGDDNLAVAWSTPSIVGPTLVDDSNLSVSHGTPSVTSIDRVGDAVVNAQSVQFTVAFDRNVVDVDPSDFALVTGGTIAGANVGGVSGSGSNYTVTVDSFTGEGDVELTLVADATVFDALGNQAVDGFDSGQTITIFTDTSR
jgi:hypothetical protein